MASKNKTQNNLDFNPPTLFTASLFLSATITIFVYMLISISIDLEKAPAKIIFLVFLIICGTLLTILFSILGTLISERTKGKEYLNELKNFKDFTDTLHCVNSEVEVYELLFEFIKKIPGIHQTTIFYRSDFSQDDDDDWKKISDSEIPLCKLSAKKCPLIQYGRECYVPNIRDSVTCSYQSSKFKSGSYICLPIVNSGYRHSILQLYSKIEHYFDALNVSKVKSYIEISKIVIHSERTVRILNQKVSTDKLTKLYNRAFVDAYLEKQIDLSRFSYKQLSLITGDIDFFKTINDTYGHAAGDYILIHFAQQLIKCTRKSDVVARYGGDEFIIVLPDTDTETAYQIAERIVLSMKNTKIPPFDGIEIHHQITCSLGLSTFPLHCDNKETLMKTADMALYKSKQAGRNCANIYEMD